MRGRGGEDQIAQFVEAHFFVNEIPTIYIGEERDGKRSGSVMAPPR